MRLRLTTTASHELGLPANGSYLRYTDLGRPFVSWTAFATQELSLSPRDWCLPVAGCVSYRGYFRHADAISEATRLEFARLIFHELAHQLLYVPGDTVFNESYAVTVERAGLERWLAHERNPELVAQFERTERARAEFDALVRKARSRLAEIYASSAPAREKRRLKEEAFATMKMAYDALQWRIAIRRVVSESGLFANFAFEVLALTTLLSEVGGATSPLDGGDRDLALASCMTHRSTAFAFRKLSGTSHGPSLWRYSRPYVGTPGPASADPASNARPYP